MGGDLEVDHIYEFSNIFSTFIAEYEALDINEDKYELFSLALKYPAFWNKENLRTLCRKCNRERRNRVVIRSLDDIMNYVEAK